MNFMVRVALQLLAAAVLFALCVQAVAIGAVWLIWPGAATDEQGLGSFQIFTLVLCAVLFLLTLLLIGWYLGKPVYLVMVWIRRLAGGNYESPLRWDPITRKNGSLKIPYAVYKELFEHLRMLASTLQQNEKELRQAEQTKQEWIQGISHDLKTPLAYIAGYSAMLTNGQYRWSEAERQQFLSVIHQKATHLQELVQDLNETMEGQIPLRKEAADLAELTRRTVADIGSAPWAEGYSFSMESEPASVPFVGDPKLLTRAIRNLLVNAVVHNPEGTGIAVRLSLLPDRTAEIRIEDDGIGFAEPRSSSGESPAERPGLGLSIARQLVEAHGGTFSIFSKPGEGTSLSIRLPLAQS
ncbi:sensor histidine kinase [Cohnella zeiphila]|uniref:histidine kinase n=1 Tax=Cohnella zeiphila TaxID=2761120 RepID=A0A7X0SQ07_9BACL|nr:HAMP domain-containing sensor histidine kinase [Cohnella zeiphila]MBB6733954.1 HAMP domain-containing histidine kinase [Cohnella zeiphila]